MEVALTEIPADHLVSRPANVPSDRVLDFDIYRPLPDGQDLHDEWRSIMSTAPHKLMWTPHNGGHWIALSADLSNEVLAESDRFSSRIVLVPKDTAGEAYKLIPLSLDPPEHRPFRKLLNDNMSPKSLSALEQRVTDLTVELIEGFRPRGRCNFVHDFAEQLPVRIFMGLVDLPIADLPKLKHLADQFTRPDGSLSYPEVKQLFKEYITPVIAERRGGEGTDLISKLINGQVEGRSLSDDEAADTCIQVLVGGLDTVVNAMAFAMSYLAQDTELRDRIAAHPDRIGDAVWELLRRFPLVSSSREVRQPIEVDGVQLQPGEMVMAPTAASALDPTFGEEMTSVDLDRRNRIHSVFGRGNHTCPGAYIARTELQVMIREWCSRIPDFRLAPGEQIEHVNGIVGAVKPFDLVWDV